ncbi:MAG TPA: 4-(cytidine 5'-diphospho)-2-C-methyl-D-erythritol kinase [Segetibacter sp.]|jgi:4-diphosphocytidyl-2-C-methyl-D-erythritol kinase
MITFPNCKINLGLNVTRKRKDGYHDLETVFLPIGLKDSLELIQSTEFKFQTSGLQISGDEESNLCVKAYRLLKEGFPELPPVHIHLHKAIPMGAGLGGGSADTTFMLMMLNKKFKLNIAEARLLEYALSLGSDCPFFIINKPSFARGRGELLEPIALDLSSYKIVLVNSGIHVSTKEAFAQLIPKAPEVNIKEVVRQHVQTWREEMHNDFEDGVFKLHPELKRIKEELYNKGAIYAAMTGTGSTVYGFFEKDKAVNLNFPPNYLVAELPA